MVPEGCRGVVRLLPGPGIAHSHQPFFRRWRWADAHYPITAASGGRLMLDVPPVPSDRTTAPCSGDCPPAKGGSFYVYNVLAELDTPGEVYLRREDGMLYLWPTGDNITVSVAQSVVRISYATDITWDGIDVAHAQGAAMVAMGASNITVTRSTINHAGMMALNVTGGSGFLLQDSVVTSAAAGGVYLGGGDRPSLSASRHSVDRCDIHANSRWVYSMAPAVFMAGVGQSLTNSEVYDHPQNSIWVQGNDHTTQGNTIHDVCYEALDSGSVYSGRDYTYRGNRVVNNSFYNINSFYGNDVNAVYLDDLMSGWTIVGNNFTNVSFALQLGGGRENLFLNNTVDLTDRCGISFDDRGLGWDAAGCKPGGINYGFLSRVPYQSAAWAARYGPYLANMTTDSLCTPKYNRIEVSDCLAPGQPSLVRYGGDDGAGPGLEALGWCAPAAISHRTS